MNLVFDDRELELKAIIKDCLITAKNGELIEYKAAVAVEHQGRR
jgi:hypothetical protein